MPTVPSKKISMSRNMSGICPVFRNVQVITRFSRKIQQDEG